MSVSGLSYPATHKEAVRPQTDIIMMLHKAARPGPLLKRTVNTAGTSKYLSPTSLKLITQPVGYTLQTVKFTA